MKILLFSSMMARHLRHLGLLCLLDTLNSTAVNVYIEASVCLFPTLWNTYLEMKLLGRVMIYAYLSPFFSQLSSHFIAHYQQSLRVLASSVSCGFMCVPPVINGAKPLFMACL